MHRRAFEMSRDMRFPTMWYVRPAKTQISLRIHAVWSEPLLVAWIFSECYDTDWTSFWVSKLKRRLHRLVWVYTCQNATFIVWKAHVAAQITNPHGIQKELPFKGPSAFKIACRIILYSKLLNFLLTVPRRNFFICVRRWHIALYVSCSLVFICWERG